MSRKVVDLSLDELGALGAKAAQAATRQALDHGLEVMGTVEIFNGHQRETHLAKLLPFGTIPCARKLDACTAAEERLAAASTHVGDPDTHEPRALSVGPGRSGDKRRAAILSTKKPER